MTTTITPRGDGPDPVASFSGSLADVPLASVLRRVAVEERSGELHVTAPSFNKTVYFDRGFVVFASSDLKDDRLGESMIEAGRISRHEFALASMLMKSTKQKFGAVLVEAGIVPEEELGRFVAAQVNRIVLSLFLAKTGDYRFDEGPCTVPVELMVSLSVYRILMDGVRRMSKRALVLAGLPTLDTALRIVDQPPFTLDFGKLRADEKSVLRAAREGATIQSIVDTLSGHEGVTLRACYGLLCGGILEPVAAEPKRRLLQVQEETGTFVLSEIRHRAGVSDEPRADEPLPDEAAAPFEAVDPGEPGKDEQLAPPIEPMAPPRRAPTPAQPRDGLHEVASDGFTLADLLDWFARAWSTIRGWFGGTETETVTAEHRRVERRKRPASPVVTAKPAPPPPIPTSPPTPKAESIGVPSWSQKDDPSGEGATAESDHVGVPSWSLKSDAGEAPDPGAVPSWSSKDEPQQAPTSRTASPTPAPKPASPTPSSERLEPPAWSIMDSPEAAPHNAGGDAPVVYETLGDIDDEFFIEGAISADDDSSMLSQIPREEVTLGENDVALDDDEELEIGFELEVEEDVVPEPTVPKTPPAPTTPPRPASKPEPPRVRPAKPKVKPVTANRSKDYEIPDSDEVKISAHGDEMRRMKQSGGESRLLRDVKLHFRMHDWQGAVPLLEQLVVISPGKALYRGMLGRAISRDPVRRKDAEEHFVEALRLSPQDPELHYWLGLYYKSFGLSSRAIHEFRTTLRINPKHEGARKQIGGGKKDDAFGNVIKKLFG